MTVLPPATTSPNPDPRGSGQLGSPMPQSMPANLAGNQPNPGIDIWGILQRRKYLVALFCIIGGGLGFLYFTKAPKVYSSTTRLMVTTQAPPMMVDGNLRVESHSMEKHSSLVASEMVLSKAARNGGFEQMASFQDEEFLLDALSERLRVRANEEETTLAITCEGPDPDDLPDILNQIVATFEGVIREDSESISEKTIDYIEALEEQLSGDKDDAEIKFQDLWGQLGIQEIDQEGNAINPHARKLADVMNEIDDVETRLTEVQDRMGLLAKNLEKNEAGELDQARVQIAALDAGEYLQLNRSSLRDAARNNPDLMSVLDTQKRLQLQAWEVEKQLGELVFERSRMSNKLGAGSPEMRSLTQQIDFYTRQKQQVDADLAQAERSIREATRLSMSSEEGEDQLSLDELREKENRDWIRMYQIKLEQEQESLLATLNRLQEQEEEVSQKAQTINAGINELNRLRREIDKKGEAVDAILDKLQEMTALNSNYTMTNVRTLDEPRIGEQVAPSLPKTLGGGIVLGFLAGLGLAILIDQSELAYRNPNEIFERLQIPVVGRIPRINIRALKPTQGHASLVAAHKPSASASESFRDVRTALFFRSNLEDIKTIMLTSPSPGDGKSTTIGNLAISIAQAGKKVVLVDADFRRPRVHQYFGQEMEPGMLNVLSGDKKLKEAIQRSELQENLFLLPAGGRPGNPGELVTSEAFRNLIDALRERFDYVLIDTPPVLPVADPASIASIVDGVYLVTRIRKGVKLTTQKAKETLDRVGANWMGVIVNGLDENPHYSEYGYQYGGYSYYGGVYGRYYDGANKVYREKR